MPQIFMMALTTALAGGDRLLDRDTAPGLVRGQRAPAGQARPRLGVRNLGAAADRLQAAPGRLPARLTQSLTSRPAAHALAGGVALLGRGRRRAGKRDHDPPPVALVVDLGLELDQAGVAQPGEPALHRRAMAAKGPRALACAPPRYSPPAHDRREPGNELIRGASEAPRAFGVRLPVQVALDRVDVGLQAIVARGHAPARA